AGAAARELHPGDLRLHERDRLRDRLLRPARERELRLREREDALPRRGRGDVDRELQLQPELLPARPRVLEVVVPERRRPGPPARGLELLPGSDADEEPIYGALEDRDLLPRAD